LVAKKIVLTQKGASSSHIVGLKAETGNMKHEGGGACELPQRNLCIEWVKYSKVERKGKKED
jgi:hypothetical protein